jgi:hypothetical protein
MTGVLTLKEEKEGAVNRTQSKGLITPGLQESIHPSVIHQEESWKITILTSLSSLYPISHQCLPLDEFN